MKQSLILKAVFVGAIAAGAVSLTVAADARTYVYYSVGVPAPGYVAPQPIYVMPERTYAAPRTTGYVPVQEAYEYEWRHEHRRHRERCGAARWNPQVRYMPGDAVWRHGQLFMATRTSAYAWNVNSPPEWTPSYWVPARCE